MKFKVAFLLIPFLHSLFIGWAQENTEKGKWNFNLYTELYLSKNLSNKSNTLPEFLYNHKQLNNLQLNLMSTSIQYESERIRSTLTLMLGDYSTYNLAHEPIWARPIMEANISFKVSRKHNLWLQGGVIPSHIGFESAKNWENWTLSRNLSSENSPYYQTGLAINYLTKNEKWTFKAFLLTGWQVIVPTNNLKFPSFGTQAQVQLSKTSTISWNQFIGHNQGKYDSSFRYYSNLYYTYRLMPPLDLCVGFDIGIDKKSLKSYGAWATATGILRYTVNSKWRMAFRGELFNDPNSILLSKPTESTNKQIKLSAYSINLDWTFHPLLMVRIETKLLHDKQAVYIPKRTNILASIALQFNFNQKMKTN